MSNLLFSHGVRLFLLHGFLLLLALPAVGRESAFERSFVSTGDSPGDTTAEYLERLQLRSVRASQLQSELDAERDVGKSDRIRLQLVEILCESALDERSDTFVTASDDPRSPNLEKAKRISGELKSLPIETKLRLWQTEFAVLEKRTREYLRSTLGRNESAMAGRLRFQSHWETLERSLSLDPIREDRNRPTNASQPTQETQSYQRFLASTQPWVWFHLAVLADKEPDRVGWLEKARLGFCSDLGIRTQDWRTVLPNQENPKRISSGRERSVIGLAKCFAGLGEVGPTAECAMAIDRANGAAGPHGASGELMMVFLIFRRLSDALTYSKAILNAPHKSVNPGSLSVGAALIEAVAGPEAGYLPKEFRDDAKRLVGAWFLERRFRAELRRQAERFPTLTNDRASFPWRWATAQASFAKLNAEKKPHDVAKTEATIRHLRQAVQAQDVDTPLQDLAECEFLLGSALCDSHRYEEAAELLERSARRLESSRHRWTPKALWLTAEACRKRLESSSADGSRLENMRRNSLVSLTTTYPSDHLASAAEKALARMGDSRIVAAPADPRPMALSQENSEHREFSVEPFGGDFLRDPQRFSLAKSDSMGARHLVRRPVSEPMAPASAFRRPVGAEDRKSWSRRGFSVMTDTSPLVFGGTNVDWNVSRPQRREPIATSRVAELLERPLQSSSRNPIAKAHGRPTSPDTVKRPSADSAWDARWEKEFAEWKRVRSDQSDESVQLTESVRKLIQQRLVHLGSITARDSTFDPERARAVFALSELAVYGSVSLPAPLILAEALSELEYATPQEEQELGARRHYWMLRVSERLGEKAKQRESAAWLANHPQLDQTASSKLRSYGLIAHANLMNDDFERASGDERKRIAKEAIPFYSELVLKHPSDKAPAESGNANNGNPSKGTGWVVSSRLARFQVETGDYHSAATRLDQLIQLRPNERGMIRRAAIAHWKDKAFDRAGEYWSRLEAMTSESAPEWSDYAYYRIYCLCQTDRLEAAKEVAKIRKRKEGVPISLAERLERLVTDWNLQVDRADAGPRGTKRAKGRG